ncbi:MAG TPA: hypothetical protein VJ183_03495 [Chloroflexia bacterium]|nr:hypothetical protein [Chloroflexia bacterium]
MSDQRLLDPMDEHLRGIAASFPYPPTPDIAGAMRQRLARVNTAQPATVRPRRRLAWGLAALSVLLFLAALLTVPEVQAFVRSLFRIGAIEVVVATPVPTSDLTTPEPSPIPSNPLDLVGETTLALANEELPFTIKLPTYPADLGKPDRVFVQDLNGSALILAWTVPGNRDQARLVLYALGPGVHGEKMLRGSTIIEETSVKGQSALWVRGSHWLRFYGEGGRPEFAPRRLVSGNLLLWKAEGITYRLETTLPLEEAIRIAESLAVLPDIETPLSVRDQTPPGWARNLASATTLDDARKRVSFTIKWPAYPSYVGEPDLVFYQDLTGPMVILAWYAPVESDRMRTLLYEMAVGSAAEKTLAGRNLIEETLVHGHPARWGSTAHLLTLYDEGGGGNLNSERYVPGSVLLWEEDGVAYRLETPADLSEAVKIAESVR